MIKPITALMLFSTLMWGQIQNIDKPTKGTWDFQAQKKWDQAETACQKALGIYRSAPGHEVAAGQTAALLGKIMVQAGHFKEAIELLQEALRLADEQGAQDHIPVGRVLNNLGLAQGESGQWDQAEISYGKAHETNLQEKGSDHPDTIASKQGLDKALNFLKKNKAN